jgi:hypothetical protein
MVLSTLVWIAGLVQNTSLFSQLQLSASISRQMAQTPAKPKALQIVLVCPQSEIQQLMESGVLRDSPTEEYMKTLESRGFHLKKLDDLRYAAAYIPPPKEVNGVTQAKVDAVWKKVLDKGVPVMIENLTGADRKIMTDLFKMMTGFNPEPGSAISASIESTKSVQSGGKTWSVTESTTQKKDPKDNFKGLPCLPVKPEEAMALSKTYGAFLSPNREPHTVCFNWSAYVNWDVLPSLYSKAMDLYGGLMFAAQKKRADDWKEYAKGLKFQDGTPIKPPTAPKSNDPAVQAEFDKIRARYGPGADGKEIGREMFLNLTFVYNNAGKTESFGIGRGLGKP